MEKLGNRRKTGVEQYYTPKDLAFELSSKLVAITGIDNTFLEPAGGNGSFIDALSRLGAKNIEAVDLYPNQHNLIISLGTCITYNFVNITHEFLGGSISPGMQMRFRAMHEQTALLPLIEASNEFPLVGYDTKTNLLSGVILGMAAEIDGIIAAYADKYGNFNVLLTGGDISYFVPHIKKRIFADQNLIYKGLYAICEKNN